MIRRVRERMRAMFDMQQASTTAGIEAASARARRALQEEARAQRDYLDLNAGEAKEGLGKTAAEWETLADTVAQTTIANRTGLNLVEMGRNHVRGPREKLEGRTLEVSPDRRC